MGPDYLFSFLPFNLVPETELLEFVYAGDRFGGIWLSPTSHLGTGGFFYPRVKPSV